MFAIILTGSTCHIDSPGLERVTSAHRAVDLAQKSFGPIASASCLDCDRSRSMPASWSRSAALGHHAAIALTSPGRGSIKTLHISATFLWWKGSGRFWMLLIFDWKCIPTKAFTAVKLASSCRKAFQAVHQCCRTFLKNTKKYLAVFWIVGLTLKY